MLAAVLSVVALLSAATAVVAPTTWAATPKQPELYVRQFCQTEGGVAVYIAAVLTRVPRDATVRFAVLPLGEFPFDLEPDRRGRVESSFGLGLTGLDDPQLGQTVTVRFMVNSAPISEAVTLTCDPTANAPANKFECGFEVFRFFFGELGYPFANRGDCVAHVATQSDNPPGRGRG